MADVAVRREAARPVSVSPSWESRMDLPSVMRDWLGWDPFREITPWVARASLAFLPTFEIKENKESYLFKADVPGVRETDLEVTVTGNRLSISGKREAEKHEQTDTYYTSERSYGEFARSFTLPDGVDMNSVHADLKDGVLTVSIRKTAEAQARRVAIGSVAKKS